MRRLLQGDVGSGENIISFFKRPLSPSKMDIKVALMAPRKSWRSSITFPRAEFWKTAGYRVVLLTGSWESDPSAKSGPPLLPRAMPSS